MKILISAIHYPISAARYLADAFRRLGHGVKTIGPATGGHLPWSDQDFSAYEWTPDFALVYPLAPNHDLKRILSAVVYPFEPDLIVQCDANFLLTGSAPCPNICWAVDNHVASYSGVDFVPTQFDLFFGAHSWGYHSQDANFRWLPCAYAPQVHYQIPDAPKPFDACLIGVMYPHRTELLNALAAHGSILTGTGILGKEYNRAYNSARIAIVQSAGGDVPMRLFENAAQGCVLLCDEQKDLDKLGLTEGVHYLGYATIDEAIEQFNWANTHFQWAQEMAERGKEQLARHTYESRAQAIIDEVKKLGGKRWNN